MLDMVTRKLAPLATSSVLRVLNIIYSVIDRVNLMMSFVALLTGIVTYGGFFQANEVFSGLAHFIKGGIFFWYGILTLGRFVGAFADLGWAWNCKPGAEIVGAQKANAPTSEWVESFLIFFYGSTNVFLEHLGSQSKEWSMGDFEHTSIAVLFFGTGLCGLMLESKRIRRVLEETLINDKLAALSLGPAELRLRGNNYIRPSEDGYFPASQPTNNTDTEAEKQSPAASSTTNAPSLNPLPALTIALLGLLMSSHHQSTPVSTTIHSMWGSLFLGAALARLCTYVLLYLRPPSSYLPSRPPTELIAAFCLIAGGTLFMVSNQDMMDAVDRAGVMAMLVFTVVAAATGVLMSWVVGVLAIGASARARENRRRL
jgi:hypothetical protein